MRVFENLTFTTFLSPLLTRCYRFLTRCEYYLWLDSKYNVRRCDVLVQKNNSQSKSFALIEYFFKNGNLVVLVKPSMGIRGAVCIIVFIVSIWSGLQVVDIYVKY